MEKWIDKIFSLKSFPGKLIFVIWASSLVLVILPDHLLEKFLLTGFKTEFAKYIGPTLLVSSGIMIYMAFQGVKSMFEVKLFQKRFRKNLIKSLENLNYNEVMVMREFFIQDKDTIKAPFGDETVISLENKRLIHKAATSAVVGIDMAFPYAINQYAKEKMTLASLRLEKSFDAMNKNEIQQIISERPNWATSMERRENMLRSLF